MSQADIYISAKIADPSNPEAVIGSYENEAGKMIRGIELIDVIAQVQKYPTATKLLFHCQGPGGSVDVGDSIYDYMESLKASGIMVDTITDGDVGSILTKPFLAGTNRYIRAEDKFFIHNPWNQPRPGDSRSQEFELGILKQTEARLRAFYQQHTRITDTGLKGLMDKETEMTADQAVALGFATQKIGKKVKTFALIQKKENMTKPTVTSDSLAKKIGDFLSGLKAEITGVPAAPAVAAENPLMGKPVMIDGQPAADGVYTVMGGMVSMVEPVTEEQNEPAANPAAQPGNPNPAAGAQLPAAQNPLAEAQAKELAEVKAELAQLKAVDYNAVVDKALEKFKAELPVGTKPRAQINNNGQGNQEVKITTRTINEVMAQKAKERKEKLNKN